MPFNLFNPINWTAVSALANVIRLIKGSAQKGAMVKDVDARIEVLTKETEDSYQVALGKRHQYLREEVLKINPREMADFYGFEKVKQLEDCEDGLDELPRESMQKLEDFFFVNKRFIEEGSESLFQTFPLIYTQEGCRALLESGFEPFILTKPKPVEGDNFAYILFYKKEAGFDRMVVSNGYGSFDSNGGGRQNIQNLINVLIDRNEHEKYLDILHVKNDADWQKLEDAAYYNKKMSGFAGCADNDCYDIYQMWVKALVELRIRTSPNLNSSE